LGDTSLPAPEPVSFAVHGKPPANGHQETPEGGAVFPLDEPVLASYKGYAQRAGCPLCPFAKRAAAPPQLGFPAPAPCFSIRLIWRRKKEDQRRRFQNVKDHRETFRTSVFFIRRREFRSLARRSVPAGNFRNAIPREPREISAAAESERSLFQSLIPLRQKHREASGKNDPASGDTVRAKSKKETLLSARIAETSSRQGKSTSPRFLPRPAIRKEEGRRASGREGANRTAAGAQERMNHSTPRAPLFLNPGTERFFREPSPMR